MQSGRMRPADACDGQDLLLHWLRGAAGLIERPHGLRADGDPCELAASMSAPTVASTGSPGAVLKVSCIVVSIIAEPPSAGQL